MHHASMLVWIAERRFSQAHRITLAKCCLRDNSSGDQFAYFVSGVLKLFERGFESFAHRRSRLGIECSRLYE